MEQESRHIELNKIYNEDCILTMKRMPDNFVDLVVTSPPYDDLRNYNGYSFEFGDVAKELFRIIKHGGVVVWVVGDATIDGSETGTSFGQALYFKKCGFRLHDTMIYRKLNPMPVKSNRYLPCFEYMFVLSKGTPKTVNLLRERSVATGNEKYTGTQQENGKFTDYGKVRNMERDRYNVWEYKVGSNQSTSDDIAFEHPAIFPEQLAADHIYSWSNAEDLVYDCFGGSGTTIKMAHEQNRNWIMSEISEEYCKNASKRIAPYLAQQKLFK